MLTMRNRLIFVSILSALWILLGSWFVGTYMSPQEITIAGLQVRDGEKSFHSQDHFSFKAGGADMEVGESTREMLLDILAYLDENPNRRVILKGKYLKEELNNTAYQNLGVARAEELRKYMTELTPESHAIDTDLESVDSYPMVNGVFYDAVDFEFKDIFNEVVEETEKTNLEEDAPIAKEEFAPFKVYGAETIANLGMDPSLLQYVENIKAYLVDYPDRRIQISGHAQHNENINKAINDSRLYAQKVRRFLIKQGVKSNQITWEGIGAAEPMYGPAHYEAGNNNRVVIRLLAE